MGDENSARQEGTISSFSSNATIILGTPGRPSSMGSHLNAGNPLFKRPYNPCLSIMQWHNLDLTAIPEDFLPRVKYAPKAAEEEYLKRLDRFEGRPVTDFYRLGLREFVSLVGGRTLTACLLPPGVTHINALESVCFEDEHKLVRTSGILASLPLDFYTRQQNKVNLFSEMISRLPLPELPQNLSTALCARTLCLNCLTSWYADLWQREFKEEFKTQRWSREPPGLKADFFSTLTPNGPSTVP